MDSYDAMYDRHLIVLQAGYHVLAPAYACRHSGAFTAGLKKHGYVEHRCKKCNMVILQRLEEYNVRHGRSGIVIDVDCERVVMGGSRGRLR